MARMVYDQKLGKVVDASPGRSIYLSNKQWQQLNEFLKRATQQEKDDSTGVLTKLYRISEEVCNRDCK